MLSTDAWIAGAVGIEELEDDLRVAFSDPEAAAAFADATGGHAAAVADDTGLDEWQAHAESYQAGPFAIRPPWLPQGALPELVIDPGRAFGSGSHPSTQLATELVAEYISQLAAAAEHAPRLADIGCGSGVLSVAAATLGATSVAVDIDPAAIEAAAANADANGVAADITVSLGSVDAAEGVYDIAVINVTIDIHEAIGADVRRYIGVETVLVAGLLAGPQEQRAADAYGARIVERRQHGEWAGLVLHLHDASPPLH